MIVKLPFGHDTRAIDLRGFRVRALRPSAPAAGNDGARIVGRALDAPIEGPPLAELARGRSSALVVVPDATRSCQLELVLPEVLARLRDADIPPTATAIIIANGTHPAVGPTAARSLLGEIPAEIEIVEHDSRNAADLVEIGRLLSGHRLRLHRLAVSSQLVLTVGAVRHHYLAGFGGGPKMIFPGIAGHDEIQANHARVMIDDGHRLVRDSRCDAGLLAGNPIAEEIAVASDLAPPDLALCLVLTGDGRIAWAAAGGWRPAFSAAVERVRAWYEVEQGPAAPMIVVSGGGAPYDSTLIQAHKALEAACRFAAPGAEVLFVAGLGEGSGSPAMEEFFADPRPRAIAERLRRGWVQYGHTTLRIVDKTERFRIHLHSAFSPEVAARLGFRVAPDPDAVVDRWRLERSGESVAVMPGPVVYPRPAGDRYRPPNGDDPQPSS